MTRHALRVAPLLFGSGMCALIYQTAWFRELRLVFGVSTAASAAVMAIFMAGLGAGGLALGRRADAHPRPLAFYAALEALVAVSAAATPLLVWAVRGAYVAAGGSVSLGPALATAARLLLSSLVLGLPTFLMGGTLPAAAKAVASRSDPGRRSLALLYGANTAGALTGVVVSTFFAFEVYGTRLTLWLACLVNLIVAVLARGLARRCASQPEEPAANVAGTRGDVAPGGVGAVPPAAPVGLVLTASAITGFAFLLMEMVWYRMLGPLLGGTVFTFGLILAVALLGIGVGGIAYAYFGHGRRATLSGFALTCALEAVCLAGPFALGDHVAILALLLRPLGAFGFAGHLLGWAAVSALVVLPAAVVAGVQFPMLIALLGTGGDQVGRHVGLAYAWNAAGAIAGSIAGGFGVLTLFTAPGAWRAVAALLAALCLATVFLCRARRDPRRVAVAPLAFLAAAVALLSAQGPTQAWRHSAIGAGRARDYTPSPNGLRGWANHYRRLLAWERDGVESSVALAHSDRGYAFFVNGKSDGSARTDAPTQVMSGLVGAILHPKPRKALVIGLGTGSTAGWLAAIASIDRVDVVELEPAILEVARACAPVNQNVMANPKVRVRVADAREVLLTTRERYDLIVSEPSNPYRAGVASLLTREFYRAAAKRLEPGGLFLQFLQAYEVDAPTVRTVLATVAAVFPHVETWQTHVADLLLISGSSPIVYDAPALRARVAEEPFRSAMAFTWRGQGLEALLANFVAGPSLAGAIAKIEAGNLNTDDHTLVEFGFARTVGGSEILGIHDVRAVARLRGEERPVMRGGEIDWARVAEARAVATAAAGFQPTIPSTLSQDQRHRVGAYRAFVGGRMAEVLALWRRQPRAPEGPLDHAALAEALADAGDEEAAAEAEKLRAFQPAEADAVLGRLRWRRKNPAGAAKALAAAFHRYREDPWPLPVVMSRALDVAAAVAQEDALAARVLFEALHQPFSLELLREQRLGILIRIDAALGAQGRCAEVLAPLEPHVPWSRPFLLNRLKCYSDARHALAGRALADFDAFVRREPARFGDGLRDEPTPSPAEPGMPPAPSPGADSRSSGRAPDLDYTALPP